MSDIHPYTICKNCKEIGCTSTECLGGDCYCLLEAFAVDPTPVLVAAWKAIVHAYAMYRVFDEHSGSFEHGIFIGALDVFTELVPFDRGYVRDKLQDLYISHLDKLAQG